MRRRINNLINLINEEAGIDIFRNTRQRQYVESRALLIYILRHYFGMRLSEMQTLFKRNGYPIHHATILHALKSFKDIYLPYNPPLQDLYDKSIQEINDKVEFKIRDIQSKIESVPEDKLDEVKKLIESYDTK